MIGSLNKKIKYLKDLRNRRLIVLLIVDNVLKVYGKNDSILLHGQCFLLMHE